MATIATVQSQSTTPAGVPLSAARQLLQLAPVLVQLGLVTLIIRLFHLESRSLFYVMVLVTLAFPFHALLPMQYRLRAFVVLSLIAIVVALGVLDGVVVILMAISMIALCMLPIRVSLRVAAVLALGALWALARVDLLGAGLPGAIWPILGSMFMFRVALYLYYASNHPSSSQNLWNTAAYFFMLPNVCFPLFPVVDHGTFLRCHYSVPPITIYERGAKWMVRGVLHLLLYRLVYLHLTIEPKDVADLGGLVRFFVSTFLLYLRVSGQFHLIIGVMHLFGFYLPETHKLYYLASSITDFWRRINIYWKDFMMKLVYYPSYFRLRRFGDRTALVLSTVTVFLVTWLLHSYQWFWLRRDFPITAQDMLFWGILCVVVVIATLRESRVGRQRTLTAARGWSFGHAWRTTAMFAALCTLWSLWSSESLGEWLWMWRAAAYVSPTQAVMLVTLGAGFFTFAGWVWDAPVTAPAQLPFWHRTAVRNIPILIAVFVLGLPAAHAAIGGSTGDILVSLRSRDLNQRDQALRHKGYYEKLNGGAGAQLASGDWAVNPGQDAQFVRLFRQLDDGSDDGMGGGRLTRRRPDFLMSELRPSVQVMHKGEVVTTNSMGIRGREYSLHKSPGTIRIALLGPSYIMGSGVGDHETIAARLEQRLNAAGGTSYEVLNFGVSGYSFLQQMAQLEERVLAFEPDLVLVTVPNQQDQENFVVEHLMRVVTNRVPTPYPELDAILRETGVNEVAGDGVALPGAALRRLARAVGIQTRMPAAEAQSRLRARIDDILSWSLRRVARVTREHGATPGILALNVVLPQRDRTIPSAAVIHESNYAVFNLLDVYDDHDLTRLRFTATDDHPNARACQLIAERLSTELQRRTNEF
jgi:alginate O-acetyltransferase complex protein AlgI